MTTITRGTEKQIAFAEAIIAEIETGKRRYDFHGSATPMAAFEAIRAMNRHARARLQHRMRDDA